MVNQSLFFLNYDSEYCFSFVVVGGGVLFVFVCFFYHKSSWLHIVE